MANIKHWIKAARPRTLPLSLACIGMGAFLAAYHGAFNGPILVFCILTTIFLQVLSNFSNDYGDSVHGADSKDRQGPERAVQSGAISLNAMKNAMKIFSAFSIISGLILLWLAFSSNLTVFGSFFLLGLLSVAAAITYTSGNRPYGYSGLGDLSVFIFFGMVGVLGTYYLFTMQLNLKILLPAFSCGLFSVAVLNVNNIRDIESDQQAGKKSIPVRIGRKNATYYHWFLLVIGFSSSMVFILLNLESWTQLIFLITLPLFIRNGWAVTTKKNPEQLDPFLKQMALSTLFFVLSFGFGLLLA